MKPFNPRPRPCPVCMKPYVPARPMQAVCGPVCAAKKVRQDKAEERAKVRTRKEAIKTIADLKREAQTELNRWIVRVRDKDLPCISCGRFHLGQWHAGHYLSRGSAPHNALNPLNLAKQCAPCNTYLHGNQALFRIGLIARIGIEAVEALESNTAPHKWSREELIQIRDEYKAKAKGRQ